MVVVLVPAPAVAELTRVVRKRVDRPGAREEGERPVDRREPDLVAPSAEAVEKLLGGYVVAFAHQLGENVHPLAGRSRAEASEKTYGPPALPLARRRPRRRFALRAAHLLPYPST